MKINRVGLIEALQAVSPGLASKEVIEQSTSYVFTNNRVYTYNDEIAVSCPAKVDFEGAISAKEFLSILNKVKSEEIELNITSGELLLKGSKAKAGLRLQAEINLPINELAQPEDSDWKKLPELFSEAVSFCLFSVSRDQTKPVLTCLHVNKHYVESCDNYRITRYDMGKEAAKVFKEPVLIPANSVKNIISYSPTEYARTDGWIHFRNKNSVQYSCRTLDEQFPEVAQLLEVSGSKIQFPSNLIEILDRASVFSNGEKVLLSANENKLDVFSESDSGWFKEASRISYNGDSVDFEISPDFMKNIMKITDVAEVSDRVLKFTGDKFVHVVALIKVKKEK